MKVSLHAFCKEHGLAKSSVHRKAQELGIITADGLSAGDCDRLLVEFGKVPVVGDVVEAELVDRYSNPSALAVLPQLQEVQSDMAIAPRIQPKAISYDTTELDVAARLNQESMEFNTNAMGAQLIEQMKQIGRLHAAQARAAYAHTVASELSDLVSGSGKPQEGQS